MITYFVLTGDTAPDLSREVNKALREFPDCKLQGGASVCFVLSSPMDIPVALFCQALTCEVKAKKPSETDDVRCRATDKAGNCDCGFGQCKKGNVR